MRLLGVMFKEAREGRINGAKHDAANRPEINSAFGTDAIHGERTRDKEPFEHAREQVTYSDSEANHCEGFKHERKHWDLSGRRGNDQEKCKPRAAPKLLCFMGRLTRGLHFGTIVLARCPSPRAGNAGSPGEQVPASLATTQKDPAPTLISWKGGIPMDFELLLDLFWWIRR